MAAEEAEEEAERIATETAPDDEEATSAKFGVDDGDIGSVTDFEITKTVTDSSLGASEKKTALQKSNTATSGLGFS